MTYWIGASRLLNIHTKQVMIINRELLVTTRKLPQTVPIGTDYLIS